MNKYSLRATFGMLVLLCSLPAFSQTTHSLSLKQALQLTLQHNPKLTAYPHYVRQLEGEYSQAEVKPTPNAELEISSDEATLTLSQSFELGNKRQARIGFTNAKQKQLQAEFEIAKLDTLAETSRRYYQLLALQKQKTLLVTRIGQEKRALKIITKRAKAGAVAQADVATMALGLAHSNNTLEQLEFDIQLQQNALGAMWLEQHLDNTTELKGNLAKLPQLPSQQSLTEVIESGINQLPDYRYQIALSRLADRSVSLSQSNSSADLNLGLGLRHDDATGNQDLVFTASMPLNFNNPNRGRITSAQAQQALSYEQVELKRQQLSIALTRLQTLLEKELQQAQRISDELLPLASELLSDTQKAYRQGQYSVLQWIDAQNKVFNLEQDLINSQVRIFHQILELERILGQSIINAE